MPTNLATDLPSAAPQQSKPFVWWLGLEPPWADAAGIFERKYGYPPQEQRPAGPILLVGPIGGGRMNWRTEWPTERGDYWFYGWCWKSRTEKPEMHLVQVRQGGGDRPFPIYVTNGHFVFRGEGANGKWLKANIPDPPEAWPIEGGS